MRHPFPRNSGELLQDWAPIKPLPVEERCKAALADALAAEPREKRALEHSMLCDGWTGEQIAAAKRALGVLETGVMCPAPRGLVVFCSIPDKTPSWCTAYRGEVPTPAFQGPSNNDRREVVKRRLVPYRLGAPKRS